MASNEGHKMTTPQSEKKEYPWYAIPAILSMLMVSSGAMVALLGYGIAQMSSATY